MDKGNETQVPIETEFINLNISDKDSSSVNISDKNCSYCNKPFIEELWCKECDPRHMFEGWTSGNNDIDKFIKDTIYDARNGPRSIFLEWVPFDRFKDVKQIGVGGFAKVYSATWIDGKAEYDYDWKRKEPQPIKVALKRLNGSKNMSAEYLNELKINWDYCKTNNITLKFYGMTKDPETEELMMILEFADRGTMRSVLSHNFNNILWKDKILYLLWIAYGLNELHKLGYFHKDFHSGNILQIANKDRNYSYISDFGLSGPSTKQKSDDKICGVMPYVAPEVLNGEPYSLSSDIYSFGIIMTELSSGKPPFYKRKHDTTLALEICNGLRPEFGKGTPEIYKKLAYKCMNANSNQRPTASELFDIIQFWHYSSIKKDDYQEKEKFGYKGKEIKAMFEEADKEIPNISTLYEINPDAIYTSRVFTFSNLTKPVNSSIITSYLDEENNEDCKDSKLFDLEVSSSLQLKGR
ncbi:kinase-like domain-containing protein [Rhizophagus irregularis DAOM 181602=DAOM 197198]|uniref:Cdc15p n=2 Tax=Rhizophagus irregularis TaxID=588596 RepID=A0A015K9Y8_RHIIW|nr:kinase-like domain-containing protein [Rhizophagus irregularis DAOM 181602=DAOM 197198]EXX76395.1 Cdc15p [Rhizophagus irregularis DAOM 197198w]POG58158.1 kinase-like domain-containing protein [Rhizophagus irregularis DAOM 181602=DAOM 197198]|eukprot:XP_025165024.1 kinase-like domain-containing protein [Rhizophagus irregularis DAOM 181602=DAOM 197198]